MINIRILPVRPNYKDSVILIGEEYNEAAIMHTDSDEARKAMDAMFKDLYEENIFEILLKSRISDKTPETLSEVTENDILLCLNKDGWHNKGNSISAHTLRSVLVVAGLIVWTEDENCRFKERVNFLKASRTCMICKKIQAGEILGYANLSNAPIPKWPAKHCLNPDCLSHKINKMIDPDYEVPEEVFSMQDRQLWPFG